MHYYQGFRNNSVCDAAQQTLNLIFIEYNNFLLFQQMRETYGLHVSL